MIESKETRRYHLTDDDKKELSRIFKHTRLSPEDLQNIEQVINLLKYEADIPKSSFEDHKEGIDLLNKTLKWLRTTRKNYQWFFYPNLAESDNCLWKREEAFLETFRDKLSGPKKSRGRPKRSLLRSVIFQSLADVLIDHNIKITDYNGGQAAKLFNFVLARADQRLADVRDVIRPYRSVS